MSMKKLKILYEDKNILIINKEPKILTISDGKTNNTLYNEVYDYLHKKNQKVFIVHRLDKETSGLIIFAKNEDTKNYFQDNWSKVIRKYYGVVEGKMNKPGTIKEYLTEDKTLKTYATTKDKGKLAITNYEILDSTKAYTLLDIEILTGRKNQIRVGLANLKHPLTGDKKYGATKNPINRLALHAYYLKFTHPKTKEIIEIKDDIPKLFKQIFTK